MQRKPLPDQIIIKTLLSYNFYSGILTWNLRPIWMFKTEQSQKAWNSRWGGQEAGTTKEDGYVTICLFGNMLKAHRIAWKIVTGRDPEIVDHINGVQTDNRWANLRDVDHIENCKNQKLNTVNSSGHIGVYLDTKTKKWRAQIQTSEGRKCLGRYEHKSDAVAARAKADIEYGFHKNHGRVDA